MTVMRDRFDQGDLDGAVAIAKSVAPFVHAKPRPQSPSGTIDTLRDHQLVELCQSGLCESGDAGAGVTLIDPVEPGDMVPARAG